MLYLSLIVSGVFLLITNVFASKSKKPVTEILVTSTLFALGGLGLCMVMLPPVVAKQSCSRRSCRFGE